MYAAIAILLLGGALALQTLVLENGVFSLSSILSLELPYIYAVEKSRTDEPEPTPMRNADELILFEPVDIEKDVDSSIKFEILSAPDIGEIDLKGTSGYLYTTLTRRRPIRLPISVNTRNRRGGARTMKRAAL